MVVGQARHWRGLPLNRISQSTWNHRSPRTSSGRLSAQRWIVGTVLLLTWAALAVALFLEVVQVRGEASDFYPRWVGARAMLRGTDPYPLDITMQIPAPYGVDSVHVSFLYPATITYVLLPFWILGWPIAVSLWSSLQLLLICASPILVFDKLEFKPSPIVLGMIVLFSTLVYRHSVNTVLLGQFVGFVLAATILAAIAIEHRRSWPAALAMVLATIRPEGIVFVGLICLWLLKERRHDVLARFALVMAGLLMLSFVQLGNWLPEFVAGMVSHSERGLSQHPLAWLGVAGWLVGAFVVGWAFWMHRRAERAGERSPLLGVLALASISLLIVLPQTNNYTLVYLLLPIWLVIGIARGHRRILLAAFVLLVSPWLYELTHIELGIQTTFQQLMSPLSVGVLLTAVLLPAEKPRRLPSLSAAPATTAGRAGAMPVSPDLGR